MSPKYNLSFVVTFPIQNRCISLPVHQRSVNKGSALLCTNTEKAISPWNRAFSDKASIILHDFKERNLSSFVVGDICYLGYLESTVNKQTPNNLDK